MTVVTAIMQTSRRRHERGTGTSIDMLLLLPISILQVVDVSNGDFEDGLRGWHIHCGPLERCGEVKTELHPSAYGEDSGCGGVSGKGSNAAALQASADEWTAVQLRQRLVAGSDSAAPREAITAEASFREQPGSWRAPLELRLSLAYEDASTGEPAGSCEAIRDELPLKWERLRVDCAPPQGVAKFNLWVIVSFACVRSSATLLVDNVAVRAAAPVSLPKLAMRSPTTVPPVVHFIFGLSPDFGGKPFGLVHHLVIRAAVRSIGPRLTYFHYAHEPRGEWWERTKPLLALRKVKPPMSINGHPLRRFPHQADVLRLELLLQFGGTYLDMDVMLLRPTTPLLAQAARSPGGVVLAHEGIDGTIGAGNAFMVTTPNASVVQVWYGKYRDFSDGIWNGFSVRLPMDLAVERPGSVVLLNYTSLYWPPWNPWGVAQLYRTPRCLMPGSIGVHLWETKMWRALLSKLTAELVNRRDTCFARIAAAVLDGSYNFQPATLEADQPAETTDTILSQVDLSAILQAEHFGESTTTPLPSLPSELQRFKGGIAGAQGPGCEDRDPTCPAQAAAGECERNAALMHVRCQHACGAC